MCDVTDFLAPFLLSALGTTITLAPESTSPEQPNAGVCAINVGYMLDSIYWFSIY